MEGGKGRETKASGAAGWNVGTDQAPTEKEEEGGECDTAHGSLGSLEIVKDPAFLYKPDRARLPRSWTPDPRAQGTEKDRDCRTGWSTPTVLPTAAAWPNSAESRSRIPSKMCRKSDLL